MQKMTNVLDSHPADPVLGKIILDSIGIAICLIASCKTFAMILFIIIRCRFIKSKEKILFLLSINMYVNVFIFALFTLHMFLSMIRGHLQPHVAELHDDTLACRLRIYFSTITLISALYSNALQGFHRFFRIRFYKRPFLHRNIYLYLLGICIQVLLSALLQLPVLLPGHYDYEDYHCQVYLTNWRGILTGACLVWLPPVILTVVIYTQTMYFIHCNSLKFSLRRKLKIKRDLIVIKRVLWTLIFIIIFGTPAVSMTVVYFIFGYIGWWANHLTWLTFITSFFGMTIVHTYYATHIHALYSRTAKKAPLILKRSR